MNLTMTLAISLTLYITALATAISIHLNSIAPLKYLLNGIIVGAIAQNIQTLKHLKKTK